MYSWSVTNNIFQPKSNKVNFLIVPNDKNKKGCAEGLRCATTEQLWLLEPSGKADLPGCLGVSEGIWGSRHERLRHEDLKFKVSLGCTLASLGCTLRPVSKGDLETPGALS